MRSEMKTKLINKASEFIKIENDIKKKLEILFQYPMTENFKLHEAFAVSDEFEEFSDFCEVSYNELENFLDSRNIIKEDVLKQVFGTSSNNYFIKSYSGDDFIIRNNDKATIKEYITEKFRSVYVSYYHLLEMIEAKIDFDTGEFTKGGIKGYYAIDDLNEILENWEDELNGYENEKYMFDQSIDNLIAVAEYINNFKANQVENFKSFQGVIND